MTLLAELKGGATILTVTHDPRCATRAQRIVHSHDDGKVVDEATTDEESPGLCFGKLPDD